MKLQTVLDLIPISDIASIEEYCGSRFCGNHLRFGFGESAEVTGENDESHLFQLMGNDDCDLITHIDIHQEVTFDKYGDLTVFDTDGNHLTLRFARWNFVKVKDIVDKELVKWN